MTVYLLIGLTALLIITIIVFIVHNQRRPLYQFDGAFEPEESKVSTEQVNRLNFNFSLPKIKINLFLFQMLTAILSLFFLLIAAIKEVGSPWLMLSGLFFLIYLVLQRINSFKRRYKRRKVSKILKLAFSHSFWLWGFIFLTGLWLIFFVI